jgi:hypothetical protein
MNPGISSATAARIAIGVPSISEASQVGAKTHTVPLRSVHGHQPEFNNPTKTNKSRETNAAL